VIVICFFPFPFLASTVCPPSRCSFPNLSKVVFPPGRVLIRSKSPFLFLLLFIPPVLFFFFSSIHPPACDLNLLVPIPAVFTHFTLNFLTLYAFLFASRVFFLPTFPPPKMDTLSSVLFFFQERSDANSYFFFLLMRCSQNLPRPLPTRFHTAVGCPAYKTCAQSRCFCFCWGPQLSCQQKKATALLIPPADDAF